MRTTGMFNRTDRLHNPDKKTVGIFFESGPDGVLTKEDMRDISRKSHASDPIFRPNTYLDDQFIGDTFKTTY